MLVPDGSIFHSDVSLQVQRYVLQSLLELQWPSASISALPVSFIVVNVLNTFCQGMFPHYTTRQASSVQPLAGSRAQTCHSCNN